jgi:deoxycytidylate deaminase
MLSNKELNFLNIARLLASHSEEKMKHGAVVVKSGRVVGTGFNKFKNHPTIIQTELIKSHCSRHAEQVAIHQAGRNAKGAIIYVARVSKKGEDRNSRPCNLCYSLIKKVGIKQVIYTMEA